MLVRNNTNEYALSKCISSSIAGGVSVTLGSVVFIVFLLVRGTGQSLVCDESIVNTSAFHDLLTAKHPYLFLFAYTCVIFLQAMFWSVLGLLGSAFLPSKYVAYATPFVLGYVFHQVATSVGLPGWLNPGQMSTGRMFDSDTWVGLLWETIFFLVLVVVSSMFFVRTMKRRIANA